MLKTSILEDFQAYAESLIDTHKIPAISLAVWHNGQLHQAAAGILNLETGVEATTDSIFQIGSISKVMTSSLVMQLVDEGKVDLDKPVKQYIRDFAIADEEATESITVRQLLNHTNGMDGDFFPMIITKQATRLLVLSIAVIYSHLYTLSVNSIPIQIQPLQ